MIRKTVNDRRKSETDPAPQIRRFEMRASDDFLDRVDDWRRRQRKIPSRTEAIRMLCEIAFGSEKQKTRRVA